MKSIPYLVTNGEYHEEFSPNHEVEQNIQYKPPLKGNPFQSQEVESVYHSISARMLEFWKGTHRFVVEYNVRGHTRLGAKGENKLIQRSKTRMLTYDCVFLALEFYDLVGVDTVAELARKHGVSKQSVNYIMTKFRKAMGLYWTRSDEKKAKVWATRRKGNNGHSKTESH